MAVAISQTWPSSVGQAASESSSSPATGVDTQVSAMTASAAVFGGGAGGVEVCRGAVEQPARKTAQRPPRR
ncbi:MAG: hypothetical protein DI562_12905 [Stenotrophomonas acidaminiphila]|nr:MAG: hypothetical protein DI562_12905 [Stenotrophomonas acidaminiphila]